jgi:serine/threonine-protein kinase RsbW
MPEGLPAPIALHVPSHLASVRPVRRMLEALLDAQGWAEDDVDDVALIVTEVVQNAVEHGSRGDGAETIAVWVHALPRALEIVVEDPGTGRDPHLALQRDVTAPVPVEDTRGRGLYLVYRLTSRFERSLTDGGGLRVRVLKEVGTS